LLAAMTMLQHLRHEGASLAYRHSPGAGPLIVFLPGYMSDMTGSKAEALAAWAAAHGRAMLRLDYSGCGASGGDFLAGSIGRWTGDALALIDHVAPGGEVLLVGSSMGGWIALRLGLALGDRLAGLVGIAAAPDFTDWGLAISAEEAAALDAQGWFGRPTPYDPAGYRYSRSFLADAPAQRLLTSAIAITAPVRLLHGQRDDAVPWRLGLDIADRLRSDRVQVTLVKDGDHRLSRPADIALLIAAVADLLGDC
jgi:pimeloyl-ACP methyl ester carboxylesterase